MKKHKGRNIWTLKTAYIASEIEKNGTSTTRNGDVYGYKTKGGGAKVGIRICRDYGHHNYRYEDHRYLRPGHSVRSLGYAIGRLMVDAGDWTLDNKPDEERREKLYNAVDEPARALADDRLDELVTAGNELGYTEVYADMGREDIKYWTGAFMALD